MRYINENIRRNGSGSNSLIVVSPDAGGVKRAKSVADKLGER